MDSITFEVGHVSLESVVEDQDAWRVRGRVAPQLLITPGSIALIPIINENRAAKKANIVLEGVAGEDYGIASGILNMYATMLIVVRFDAPRLCNRILIIEECNVVAQDARVPLKAQEAVRALFHREQMIVEPLLHVGIIDGLVEFYIVRCNRGGNEHHVVADMILNQLNWPVKLLNIKENALVVRGFDRGCVFLTPQRKQHFAVIQI